MKLRNFLSCVLGTLLAAAGCVSFAACNTTGGGDEQIDPNRTQIYVYNFYGGYGSDWLSALKARFEERQKDTSWEEGKTGVQVIIKNSKDAITGISSQILANREEVYFTEYAYYYTLLGEGVLGDITEAVTEPLSEYGETRSVVDKFSNEQRSYYGVQDEDGTLHYYGVPHYAGYSGLIYNVDLFEEEGYYFAKTPSDGTRDGMFVDRYNTERSAGPDGVEGTFDDGLPATYEEFFILCDYIADGGTTPVTWNGYDYHHYLNNLVQALQADYEGLDQTMLDYTLNGVAKTLASVSGGNVTIRDAVTVSDSDAWQLASQAGKYYGLYFLEQLVKNDKYHNDLAFNSTFSHLNAQEDFLYAGNDGRTKPAAMLCDGVWWEMEAKETFNTMVVSKGDSYSKYNRNFAFMPLPKATQEKVVEAAAAGEDARYTLYDGIYSLCFMKANVEEWKKPLILDFIRFANTDQSLVEFTTVTNTVKALDYSLDDDDLAQLTPFGRSLVQLKAASQIVYPYSTNETYTQNQTFFQTHEQFRSTVGNSSYQWPAQAMHENNVTAADYFAGMLTYYRNNWVG